MNVLESVGTLVVKNVDELLALDNKQKDSYTSQGKRRVSTQIWRCLRNGLLRDYPSSYKNLGNGLEGTLRRFR